MQRKQFGVFLIAIWMGLILTACGGSSNVSSIPSESNDAPSSGSVSQPANPTAVPDQPKQIETSEKKLTYEIVGPNQYTGFNGETIFIGAIRNTGSALLPTFHLTMEVRDSNGSSIASDSSGGFVEATWPGELAPFWFSFDDLSSWSDYKITVDTSDMLLNMMPEFYNELTISDVHGAVASPPTSGNPGEYEITGTISNNGTRQADYIMIAIMLYDENGAVVAVGSCSADARQPGSQGTFNHRIALFDNSSTLNVYTKAVARSSQ